MNRYTPITSASGNAFSRRWSRSRTAAAIVLAVALGVSVAGCGESTPPGPSSPTLTAPSASPSASSDPMTLAAQRAIEAYRGMWRAYAEAGQTANPDDPQLAVYATDGALQNLTSGLRSIRDRGLVIKGEIILDPRVTRVEPADVPTTIEITDCADTTNSLLYRQSGELYNDEPGGRQRVIATVKDTGDGVWKVLSFGAQAIGTC